MGMIVEIHQKKRAPTKTTIERRITITMMAVIAAIGVATVIVMTVMTGAAIVISVITTVIATTTMMTLLMIVEVATEAAIAITISRKNVLIFSMSNLMEASKGKAF